MLKYPNIDPVAISIGPFTLGDKAIGPLEIHWYGIMYLLAFSAAWLIAVRRVRQPHAPLQKSQVEDLIVYGALGVILGGRCGYILFYHFDRWLNDPLWLFRVWEGGMSFHGGLLGVMVAMWLYSRKIRRKLLDILDFVAPLVPLGLAFGRIGNFIGGELYGRATDVAWAMKFPDDPDTPRHPSQLYQASLEGVLLFAILFWFSSKRRPTGAVGGLFLIGYGCLRFFVEFFRQPDAHIMFDLFGWLTRGQLLCIPMVGAGIGLMYWAYRARRGFRAVSQRGGK